MKPSYFLKEINVMVSGFFSNAMNFENVEGSFGRNVLLSAILRFWICRSIFRLCSDNAVTLQRYNHSYVIMGTIRLFVE